MDLRFFFDLRVASSINGQSKGNIGHRIHNIEVAVPELERQLLQRARWEVEKDTVRHRVMLYSSVADRERNRAQDVAGMFGTHIVHVVEVRTAQITHI